VALLLGDLRVEFFLCSAHRDAGPGLWRGKHAEAAQAAISVRLDAEVMAWLRAKDPGYSTEINRILREKMLSEA
jgi:uncharacterized protein (DUF4415 family)